MSLPLVPEQRAPIAVPPDERIDILSLSYEALHEHLEAWGERTFRVKQVYAWLHLRGATSFDDMSDIKKQLRDKMNAAFALRAPHIANKKVSDDGTRKYQLQTYDGHTVEAVFIPNASAEGRHSLCISSQVGCAMGCRFCATAAMTLRRNLTAGEIIGQYYVVVSDLEADGLVRRLGTKGPNRIISNIVYMGMGEPLHNYDAVRDSIHLLQSEHGPNMSGRRITVSTSGLVSRIEQLGEETDVHIAVSLNATTDEVRDEVMPVNKKWPIKTLLDAMRRFPMEKRRRITFEYVMLAGVNDSDDDARRLVVLMQGLKSKINLIPFNPHPLAPYKRPSNNRVVRFQTILDEGHVSAFIRTTRGDDIDAACGMLGAQELEAARRDEGGSGELAPTV